MRALLIILVLIIALAAASPFFVGSKVESGFNDLVAQYDELPLYSFQVEAYEKGYRSSQATVSVGFDQEVLQNLVDNSGAMDSSLFEDAIGGFDVYFDIQHGPLLTKNGFGLGWTDMEANLDREAYPELGEMFDALETDLLMSWKMRLGLDGSGWMESDVPDIDFSFAEDGEEVRLVLKGADGIGTFTDYGKSMASKGGIEEFSFDISSDETVQVSMKDLRIDTEFTYLDSIWMGLGSMEAGIDTVEIYADEFDATMEDMVLHAAISEGNSSETLNVRESIRMGAANFNGYQVETAEFAFAYNNISKALFDAYMQSYELILTSDPDMASDLLKDELEPVLKEAMTHSPSLDLESVAFKSDDGSMKANASFGIDSSLLGADIDFDNPFTLIPALTVLADMEISESLVKKIMILQAKSGLDEFAEVPDDAQMEQMVDMQIAMMAGPLEQQGYIKKEGENYSASFSFSKGTAAVNGLPIPIPGLF